MLEWRGRKNIQINVKPEFSFTWCHQAYVIHQTFGVKQHKYASTQFLLPKEWKESLIYHIYGYNKWNFANMEVT